MSRRSFVGFVQPTGLHNEMWLPISQLFFWLVTFAGAASVRQARGASGCKGKMECLSWETPHLGFSPRRVSGKGRSPGRASLDHRNTVDRKSVVHIWSTSSNDKAGAGGVE